MQKSVKTPEQALASLMTLCAKAERSSGDAQRLMARWGVEPGRREEVLDKLIKSRFIDDARYADAYVREKSRLAGWGLYKIKAALAAKGINRETIDAALVQIKPEEAGEKLETLLTRRARTLKAANGYDLRAKLVRYGLARGFDYETVTGIVERMVKIKDE